MEEFHDVVPENQSLLATTVKITPAGNGQGKLRAVAQVNLGGQVLIRGFRIYEGAKGLFVREPQQAFTRDNTLRYASIVQPITKEAREAIFGKILSAYREIAERMGQSIRSQPAAETDVSEDDDLPFEEDDPVMGM